ncbi:MAG: methyltransferase domain-containing protein [Betaproteobacteria bacterium]|nr:methyltransferase domain-containing protein [Betaproteobacteria bacterium]
MMLPTPLLFARESSVIRDIAVIGSGAGTIVAQVVENRSGIVHVVRNEKGGDSTFGGNLYDGRLNTDLRINSNGIHRVFVLSGLHASPRRVLVIGLSSGAWTSILSRMPGVEHIDVVEVNPGYLEVIKRYELVSGILHDPAIAIHIDDGRRWLRRNGDARYDLIVMNTTWHWRAYSTNLLSVEFLKEMKRHLRPGGIAMYNGTGSPDVVYTAAQVFSFVRKYDTFVYVADHDFLAALNANRDRIWRYGPPNAPVFDPLAAEDRKAIDDMFGGRRFETVAEVARIARRPLEVISDDNLLPEYKYGIFQYFLPGFH